jgi:DNA-binding response OmpR family regulator
MQPFLRKKILIVEDDPEMSFGLQKRLSRGGFDVVHTGNGRAAVYCAEFEQPALITLDVRLPDIDGLEVAMLLRRNPKTNSIPIVFITGKADRHFKDECTAVGGMYFIRKPYDPDLLIQLVRSLLEQDAPVRSPEMPRARRLQPAC